MLNKNQQCIFRYVKNSKIVKIKCYVLNRTNDILKLKTKSNEIIYVYEHNIEFY